MSRDSTTHDDGAEIRSRMAHIRGELRSDAGRLGRTASKLFDWTAHIRRHPWTSFGLVAALAYYLVPKRVEINSPSAEELEKLAANNKLVVESNPTPKAKSTFAAGLTALVSQTILRGAMGLIGHQIGQMLQPGTNEPPGRTPGRETPQRSRQTPPPPRPETTPQHATSDVEH